MVLSQSLTLERTSALERPIERTGTTLTSGLAYQHAEPQPLDKVAAEETCTRVSNFWSASIPAETSAATLIAANSYFICAGQVLSLLEGMARRLGQSNVVPDADRLHGQSAVLVLELLVGLDYSTLEHLYSSVMVGTSYEQETMG